tara:strand:+ start:562 stop:774 length:213 start_codon:yes stop_codon:yes gene_type:complete
MDREQKKSSLSKRINLLEMTLIRMSESMTKIIERTEILSKNQQRIIDAITGGENKEEKSNDVDESQSTGV